MRLRGHCLPIYVGTPHPDRGLCLLKASGKWMGRVEKSCLENSVQDPVQGNKECLAYEEMVVVQQVAQRTGMAQRACLPGSLGLLDIPDSPQSS